MEFLDSLNYENTVEHILVWVRKIHESVLYQAFFCLFFKLAKNEDGPEFSFLDSLKFNREGKEEVSLVFSNGSMSSLNIALFVFSDTHVLVITFPVSYYFEFLTPPLVCYTWGI